MQLPQQLWDLNGLVTLLIRWGCRCMCQQRRFVVVNPGCGVRTHAEAWFSSTTFGLDATCA
jgi:hypothetical protein